jgi:hypothetical protein
MAMPLLSQVPLPGRQAYGAVVSTERQLTALGDSDLTALTVLQANGMARLADEARDDELFKILRASTANLVWLRLPLILPASVRTALDFAGVKGVRILEMR